MWKWKSKSQRRIKTRRRKLLKFQQKIERKSKDKMNKSKKKLSSSDSDDKRKSNHDSQSSNDDSDHHRRSRSRERKRGKNTWMRARIINSSIELNNQDQAYWNNQQSNANHKKFAVSTLLWQPNNLIDLVRLVLKNVKSGTYSRCKLNSHAKQHEPDNSKSSSSTWLGCGWKDNGEKTRYKYGLYKIK